MSKVFHAGKSYDYAANYRKDDELREQFNSLTRATYGFDFEKWYQGGFWGDGFIPYSLFDGGRVVSSVSVSVIDFVISGTNYTFVQIGTVMTDLSYRNLGLNKILMEKVLKEWEEQCDLIYLFANKSVLDFYPKFGFTSRKEYQFSKKIVTPGAQMDMRKLDLSDKNDEELLVRMISLSAPLFHMSMKDNQSLIMFYLTSFMAENVYYLKDFHAVAIVEVDEERLYLKDVYSPDEIDLEMMIAGFAFMGVKEVILGFSPCKADLYEKVLLVPDDVLFVRGDKLGLLDGTYTKFPDLSHA